jgi:hypothetical protein
MQRNAARILAAKREAEVSQIKAEIIDAKADLAMQEARAAAKGPPDHPNQDDNAHEQKSQPWGDQNAAPKWAETPSAPRALRGSTRPRRSAAEPGTRPPLSRHTVLVR